MKYLPPSCRNCRQRSSGLTAMCLYAWFQSALQNTAPLPTQWRRVRTSLVSAMAAGNSSLSIPEFTEAGISGISLVSECGWLMSTIILALPFGFSRTLIGLTVMSFMFQCSSTSSCVRGPQARLSSSHCCRLSTSLSPNSLTVFEFLPLVPSLALPLQPRFAPFTRVALAHWRFSSSLYPTSLARFTRESGQIQDSGSRFIFLLVNSLQKSSSNTPE